MQRHIVPRFAVIFCSAVVYAAVLWALAYPTNQMLIRFHPDQAKTIWIGTAYRFGRTFLLAGFGALLALVISGRIRRRELRGDLLWSRVVVAGALGGAFEAATGKLFVTQMIAMYQSSPRVALGIGAVVTVGIAMLVVLLLVVRVTRRYWVPHE